MADRPEARIIARRDSAGNTELSVYEPASGREHRTGWTEGRHTSERSIERLKQTLERSGNHVTVKEL
jgi:hypothetical protein